MAKTTVTHVTDDLDGSKDASEVSFAFDGTEYTIDLSKRNLAAFKKAMQPYTDAATKAPRRGATRRRPSSSTPKPSSSSSSSSGRDLAAIRAWANENDIEVSERGRVAKAVIDQYDAAH